MCGMKYHCLVILLRLQLSWEKGKCLLYLNLPGILITFIMALLCFKTEVLFFHLLQVQGHET